MDDPDRREIVPSEEVERRVARLLEVVSETASTSAHGAPAEDLPGVREILLDRLREGLTEGLTVAIPRAGDAEIEPRERRHEIAKKALTDLRAGQLQRIAAEIGLNPDRRKDHLVEAIARALEDDEKAIGRLVAIHEEVRSDSAVTERLFPLHEPVGDLDPLVATTEGLAGRYIRVGLARWFLFREVLHVGNSLRISGALRSYRVDVVHEEGGATLGSLPTEAEAQVVLRAGRPYAAVSARGVAESRAIMDALSSATHVLRKPLEVEVRNAAGALMGWDPRTVFLVDFLDRHLNGQLAEILDLRTARFQMGTEALAPTKPEVRAVTLEGQHLLSSRAACELIIAGRGLVSVSALVRFSFDHAETGLFPIRLELSRDYFTLEVGFGGEGRDAAATLHAAIADRLQHDLAAEVNVTARLRSLADQIAERAREDEDSAEADILGPADTELG